MLLILVRHSIAEDSTLYVTDRERKLSKDGVKEFSQVVKGLSSFLNDQILIYSSPLARAKETAEILGKELGMNDIIESNDVENDNLKSFLDEIKDKGQTVIAVGHESTLSSWVSLLTGEKVFMDKGSVAFIDYVDVETSRLILLLDPKVSVKINKFLNKKYPLIKFKQLTTIKEMLLNEDANIHSLHDFRVTMRYIFVLLLLVKPLAEGERYQNVKTYGKNLFLLTDKIREYDVLVKKLQISKDEIEEVIEYISEQKKREMERLVTETGKEDYWIFVIRLLALLLETKNIEKCDKILRKGFEKILNTYKIRLKGTDLDNLDNNDQTKLHKLRITSKKLEYAPELFPFLKSKKYNEIIKEAKQIHLILGRHRDQIRNQELIEEARKKSAGAKLQIEF